MDTREAALLRSLLLEVAEYPGAVYNYIYISYPVTSMLDFLKFFRGVAIKINQSHRIHGTMVYLPTLIP